MSLRGWVDPRATAGHKGRSWLSISRPWLGRQGPRSIVRGRGSGRDRWGLAVARHDVDRLSDTETGTTTSSGVSPLYRMVEARSCLSSASLGSLDSGGSLSAEGLPQKNPHTIHSRDRNCRIGVHAALSPTRTDMRRHALPATPSKQPLTLSAYVALRSALAPPLPLRKYVRTRLRCFPRFSLLWSLWLLFLSLGLLLDGQSRSGKRRQRRHGK